MTDLDPTMLSSLALFFLASLSPNRGFCLTVPLFYATILSWPSFVQGDFSDAGAIVSLGLGSIMFFNPFSQENVKVGNLSIVKGVLVGLVISFLSSGKDPMATLVLGYVYMALSSHISFLRWMQGLEILSVFVGHACMQAGIPPFYIFCFGGLKMALLFLYRQFWADGFLQHIRSISHLSLLRG